jgi:hypothetical protein
MKFIRKKVSFVSLFMTAVTLLIAVPYQPLLAAMVPTDSTIYDNKAEEARDHLKSLISRNDIRKSLLSKGIDPDEAKIRVESLSDSEAIAVADQIEQLPAGGGAIGVIIGAALIVFLVLLATDILGYTELYLPPTNQSFSKPPKICDIIFLIGRRSHELPPRFNRNSFRIHFGYQFAIRTFEGEPSRWICLIICQKHHFRAHGLTLNPKIR